MRSIPTRNAAACVCAVVAASAFALAGCSGSSSGSNGNSGNNNVQPGPGGGTAGHSGSSSSGSGSAGSYADSSDVLSALKSAGHPCTAVSGGQGEDLKAPGLQSVTSCAIGSSGSGTSSDDVTATVFDNHTDAETYATLLTSANSSGLLISGTSQRAVLGQNWVVLIPDDTAYASQVSAALGGTVVGGASPSVG